MGLGMKNMVGLYKHHNGEEAEITQSVKRQGSVLENAEIEIVQTSFEAYTASYSLVNGAVFPKVKRPERESNNSLLTTAELKNQWAVRALIYINPLAYYFFGELGGTNRLIT
jgi:hypothetical protein